jgi:hypothetical protein
LQGCLAGEQTGRTRCDNFPSDAGAGGDHCVAVDVYVAIERAGEALLRLADL